MLYALLDPSAKLQALEGAGKLGQKLAYLEESKTLPFGEVWDELCLRADVPVGPSWIADVESYEGTVLSQR
jgi:L-rhamnose isomerase